MLASLTATAGPGWHGYGGGGFFLLGPLFAVLWIALVWVVVGLVLRRTGRGPWGPGRASAENLLAERYARGEIDAEEYEARLQVLRSARSRR